ncbi:MAG: glucose 1-dehydrogenase, partial [Patiriisocius sp.]
MSHNRPIALITGGAQGIGLACAKAIANDLDAQILLADINEVGVRDAAESMGNGTMGYVCDMADETAISSMFDSIEAEHGPVSMLVNNAGVALPGD